MKKDLPVPREIKFDIMTFLNETSYFSDKDVSDRDLLDDYNDIFNYLLEEEYNGSWKLFKRDLVDYGFYESVNSPIY